MIVFHYICYISHINFNSGCKIDFRSYERCKREVKDKLLGSYHFLPGGEGCLFMGGPEYWGIVKGGGGQFFQWVKGGAEIFEGHRGGDQNFFQYINQLRELSFFPKPKGGGPEFFRVSKGEDQNFLCMPRGDQKKCATAHHKQTTPPGKKLPKSTTYFQQFNIDPADQ